jgi:Secretion system C-terminal sorting domain
VAYPAVNNKKLIMKKQIIFLLLYILMLNSVKAQVTPYTGGDGSGYIVNQSVTLSCLLYIGGNGSGYISGNSPLLSCAIFFGDSADGNASNITPLLNCTMFFGDSADGSANNITSLLSCTMFFGDSADGSASNYSPATICPQFFGGSGDGYDMDSFKFCQVLLPIKILDFSGVKETNRNMLYWRVADAQDLRWFELERSGNGVNFVKIATINNAGTNYQFADNNPLPEINYYRLRVVERNNHIFYSGVVVLRSFTGNQFTVYPNPVQDHANVYCYSAAARSATIGLYDIKGQVVLKQIIQLRKGSNYFILHVETVKPGVYIIAIDEIGAKAKIVVL